LKILTDLVPNENATYFIDFTASVKALNGDSGVMPIQLTIDAPFDPPVAFGGVSEISFSSSSSNSTDGLV
jgi:hypothetical protein